ncbi:MAG: hypothetical protein AB7F66_13435 [Bacteriovoracia bacterium]
MNSHATMPAIDPEAIAHNWDKLKFELKLKFTRFTDLDLESIKKDFGILPKKIAAYYNLSEEAAMRELTAFRTSVAPLLQASNKQTDAGNAPPEKREAVVTS